MEGRDRLETCAHAPRLFGLSVALRQLADPPPIDPSTPAPPIERHGSIGASAPLSTCSRKGKRRTARVNAGARLSGALR